MLREIIRPTQNRIVLELPDEYVNQDIEVLAFPVYEGKSITHPAENQYPLRGKPLSYQQPFDGVAVEDWEVLP